MADPVDSALRVRGALVIVPADLQWRFSRSAGPGGQSVNTTDSRVELRVDLKRAEGIPPVLRDRALKRLAGRFPDGVVAVIASEHRSQLRNRQAARDRLARLLAEATAPPPRTRRPTRASEASVRRRLESKHRRGQVKRLRRTDRVRDDE